MTTAIGATELSACLHQYGLQANGPARLLPGGHVGQSAVVPTAQGLLVVKRCNRRFDPARVQLAAHAHQHAARAGLAPPLRLTRDGRWTAQVDDATYTVAEYVDHAKQAGPAAFAAALAALHNHLESFSPQSPCADFLQLPDPPGADLERVRRQADDAASREAIDWRITILAEFGLDAQSLAAVPRSWVHGDARPDNLLIARSPDRRLFIDFDQVSRFPRPYEIVRAFMACISPGLSADLLVSTFRDYLNAYQAVAPIHATDRAIMIDLYLTVQAAETRTFTTPEGEIRGMPAFARARHQQLTWFIEHSGLLRGVAEEAQP
ncbi:phosphotransferase [Streptomyces sp. NBC_00847]|uniref:phosphotransferase n=1 Tax=Streptomyces sp. NBC_00847 TaxID=2975850 RepID=UPI002259E599|nr:phosphotransferase [Streptomyces sp. NBC_00847]MCX4884811.1 phosphotransferase [Streptomyces sp. NBC_00847]